MMPGYERELKAALNGIAHVEWLVRQVADGGADGLVHELAQVARHAELAVHFALGYADRFRDVDTVLDLEALHDEALRSRAKTVEPPIWHGVTVPGNVLLTLVEMAMREAGKP